MADTVLTWLVTNSERVGVVILLLAFAILLVTEKLVTAGRLAYVQEQCDKHDADQEERHARELKVITDDRDFHRARGDRWEMASWQLGSGLSQAQAVAAGLAHQAGLPTASGNGT